MMVTILNSAILDSAILHKTLTQTSSIWLKLIHSHSTWWWQPSWILPSWIQPFVHKKTSLTLARLVSSTLHKNSTSLFILTQLDDLNSAAILKNSAKLVQSDKKNSLIHSDSTWWWQLSWTLPSWIQPFCTKRTSLIHSDSTWWWQPSWILPCWIQTLPSWIQTPCYLLSDSLKNTLPPLWLWVKLIPSD